MVLLSVRTEWKRVDIAMTKEQFGSKDKKQHLDAGQDEDEDEDQEQRARKISDLKEIGAELPDLHLFLERVGSLIKK